MTADVTHLSGPRDLSGSFSSNWAGTCVFGFVFYDLWMHKLQFSALLSGQQEGCLLGIFGAHIFGALRSATPRPMPHSHTYPSFSRSPRQSTTDPPAPSLSRVCKLTGTGKKGC